MTSRGIQTTERSCVVLLAGCNVAQRDSSHINASGSAYLPCSVAIAMAPRTLHTHLRNLYTTSATLLASS